ncbi:MAG TPA: AMP-binding protein, partial [Deltaproteobacteria bacterium]|nr:AMP-binding protein [Deltaproteobacteria bacterium]
MNKTQQIDAGRLKALVNLTLPQVLAVQAEYLGDRHVAIREKAYGIWQRYTWKEYLSHVRHVSLALKALGLKRNDIAAIIMDNHPEWLFSELGAQALGAVTLNLFTSAVASELIQALVRIRTPLVIAQDQEQVDKLLDQKDKLPFVKTIVYVDPTGMGSYRDNTLLMSFRELLELGQRREREHPGLFEQELGKGRADETALMIMTSGTTGVSKLAMLTHRNFTSMARQWLMTVPIGVGSDWMSMSPPAWIVDQMWGVGVTLAGGMTMNFPETPETVQQDFREIGPSILITSSRFWEDLASKIRVKIDDAGFVNRAFFSLAEKIGSAVIRYEAERRPVPAVLRALNLLASFAVFKPLLDRVGCSRFISAYTGGHPISPDVIR